MPSWVRTVTASFSGGKWLKGLHSRLRPNADRRGRQLEDSPKQVFKFSTRFGPKQRIAVAGKGGVNFWPVLLR